VQVLLVSESAEPNRFFRGLSGKPGWSVVHAHDFPAFVNLFTARDSDVEVCQADLPDGGWNAAPAQTGSHAGKLSEGHHRTSPAQMSHEMRLHRQQHFCNHLRGGGEER